MANNHNSSAPPPPYQPPASSNSGTHPPTHGCFPEGYTYSVSSCRSSNQPMGYAPQPGQNPLPPAGYTAANSTLAVTNQPGMVPNGGTFGFRESPVVIVCQFCQQTVTTSTTYVSGTITYMACCGSLLFMCFLGCCLIPFCIDGLKDVVHSCPNCEHTVGHFRRFC